jgi:hypothetical protein
MSAYHMQAHAHQVPVKALALVVIRRPAVITTITVIVVAATVAAPAAAPTAALSLCKQYRHLF